MTATVERALPPSRLSRERKARALFSRWSSPIGITMAFLLVWLIFTILAPNTFLHSRIYVSYAQTVPYFGLVALGLTMLIVAGDIDLSFSSTFAMGMVGYIGVEHATHSVTLGVLATLAIGAAAGLVNGFFVTVVGIPALVVTIGTQFLYRGLTLVVVNGRSYTLTETQNTIAGRLLVGRWFGMPMQFFWFAVIAVVMWLLMYRHRLGANAHIVGDNRQAAGLDGHPHHAHPHDAVRDHGRARGPRRHDEQLPGCTDFYPSQGAGYLLPALAAVFVGGTSVFGGRGTIWGTFVGAFLIGGIDADIVAVGLEDFYTQLIYGAIILAAVSVHAVFQRNLGRSWFP